MPELQRELRADKDATRFLDCEVKRHVTVYDDWKRREDSSLALRRRRAKALRNAEARERAMNELQGIDAEAREEGFGLCSPKAKLAAQKILTELYESYRRDFHIYPTADREVAIRAAGGRGRSVLILCDSDGGAACFASFGGVNRRARWADALVLPEGFVRDALDELFEDE